jgi:hypothetical protein
MAAKSKPAKQRVKQTPVSHPISSPSSPKTQTFLPGFWKAHWIPALCLMALSFALYGIGCAYGYVLDDELVFWKNDFVLKGFGGIRDIFASDSFILWPLNSLLSRFCSLNLLFKTKLMLSISFLASLVTAS